MNFIAGKVVKIPKNVHECSHIHTSFRLNAMTYSMYID